MRIRKERHGPPRCVNCSKCGRDQSQAHILRQMKQQVHILYRLAGGPFYHIVDGGNHNQTAGPSIGVKGDIAVIGVFYVF